MDTLHHLIEVKLHKNHLTENPDDLTARVVTDITVDVADICKSAVSRAKAPTTIEAMEHNVGLFLKEMSYLMLDGYSVNTGYFVANVQIRGAFSNPNEKFDPGKHSILFRFNQGILLRKEIPNVKVNVTGMADTGIDISHVVDSKTGSVNDLLTPGGTLKIRGGKLKIVGDNPLVGVFFEDESVNMIQVPENDIIVNNPAELIIQIPALTSGAYKLVIRNQFAAGRLLKEPRATVFDKTLTVAS